MKRKSQVLLVNPWIYDFAAYNVWIEPLGLLTIAAVLAENGYGVTVIDCLAPDPGNLRSRPDGSGKLPKTFVAKPEPLAFVPRRFGRYGLPLTLFDAALQAVPSPDLVLVATGMTYWYPGVCAAIERIRTRFGSIPLALGGVYATLCPDHASRYSGADRVIEGPGVVAALGLADEVTGQDSAASRYADPKAWPMPAHHLVPRRYAGLITSWGCPYHCTYCASHRLQPLYLQREPGMVAAEIAACTRQGVRDLAFYDDALLADGGQNLRSILAAVAERGSPVRFHTPNGLHAAPITADLARAMRRAGFATVRLSLETVDPDRQRLTGGKVTSGIFARAVANLQAAGFGPAELGAYILAGLPGQPLAEVEATVRWVQRLGVQAKLALFSPIPGTAEGDRALPAGADPLLHNHTAYPYLLGPEYVRELERIKLLAKNSNAALQREDMGCTAGPGGRA